MSRSVKRAVRPRSLQVIRRESRHARIVAESRKAGNADVLISTVAFAKSHEPLSPSPAPPEGSSQTMRWPVPRKAVRIRLNSSSSPAMAKSPAPLAVPRTRTRRMWLSGSGMMSGSAWNSSATRRPFRHATDHPWGSQRQGVALNQAACRPAWRGTMAKPRRRQRSLARNYECATLKAACSGILWQRMYRLPAMIQCHWSSRRAVPPSTRFDASIP